MSFDNIPAEVIKRILGFIPNVAQRCRLEQVSKTFQSCLQDHSGAAWTTGESKLALGRLLRNNPNFVASLGRVTSLTIRRGFSGLHTFHHSYIDALSALYRNSNVLSQLNELRVRELVSTELWNWLLSTFHNSLTKLYLKAPTPFSEGQIGTICKLLAHCTSMRHIVIKHGSAIDAANLHVALEGKRMEKLSLTDCRQITEVQLAQTVNSFARPTTFRELLVGRNPIERNLFIRFSLNEFCETLDAAAGEKLCRIELDGVFGAFLASLPTLPALFPSLRECILRVYFDDARMQATEVTQLLSEFLNAGENRDKPIHLWLVIFTEADDPLATNVWATLQLLTFNKSLRIKRMREGTRKVTYRQASLTLTFETLGEKLNPDADVQEEEEHEEEIEQEDEDENEDAEEGIEQDNDEDEEAEGNNFGNEEIEDEELAADYNNPEQNQAFMPNHYFYPHHGVVHDVDEEED